ncbi:MAG: putative 4-hydroxybenzoate polyprenyltransferase [Desulfobacteraceae bacterium]|nr:putative 4-hydroxybenzoate polyprenyltransferase [Desulfobacteraceae bacterium]
MIIKDKILIYGRMIKFTHTIFALPFALSAMVLAWQKHEFIFSDLIFILIAMVAARSAAMGFNRIVDAEIDKKNERTAIREIPSGILKKNEAVLFVVLSSIGFIFSAFMLGKICFYLSFPALGFLFLYSFTKRFTKYCHIYLGFAIGLAPIGAWIAITNSISINIIFLSLALMTYIAGFDILYSCQDIEFDKIQGLFSLPVKFGAKKAMLAAKILHVFTIFFLILMQLFFKMHSVFYIFLGIISILLIIEHMLVKPDDLKHINIAFFHMNSLVSIVLFAGVIVEVLF